MIELTEAMITNSRYAHALRTYFSETLFTTLRILAPGVWAARRPGAQRRHYDHLLISRTTYAAKVCFPNIGSPSLFS
jgi:hypothetical protein